MTIDFRTIRPIRGTQHNGFEELCCQLARGEGPTGGRYVRNGTPDGGVECYWISADGSERGFQAKYFFDLGSSQWSQMDESVETVLSTHPRLTRFTFCLPINLPDARIPKKKSQRERWDEHVENWRQTAAARGMSVEFELWDETRLLDLLSQPLHAGRRWFWFRTAELSAEWVRSHISEAHAGAGPRYTPAVHVDLPVAAIFETLGQSPEFRTRLLRVAHTVREAFDGLFTKTASGTWSTPGVDAAMPAVIDGLQAAFVGLSEDPPVKPPRPISEWLRDAYQVTRRVEEAIRQVRRESSEDGKSSSSDSDPTRYQQHCVDRCERALRDFTRFAEDVSLELTTRPALLITGEAGAGKSHLLCDVAARRATAGSPTLALLGQQLGGGDVWDQLIRRGLRLDCTREELLGALSTAAEAAGGRALILIDAINEATDTRWEDELPQMLEVIARYPRVGVAVTCRSSHVDLLVRADLVPGRLTRIEHRGFAGRPFEAIDTFCRFYGIESLNTPPLTVEFENPLLLKLYCEGLRENGLSRPPRGHHGLRRLFQTLLDAVNRKLSKPQWMDFAESSRAVHRAVDAIADAMLAAGVDRLERSVADRLLEAIVPTRGGHSRSLLRHLAAEGILTEDVHWERDRDERTPVVRFAYERQADFALVSRLLDQHLDPRDPAATFTGEGWMAGWFTDETAARRRRRLLPALITLVSELTGQELCQLVPHSEPWDILRQADLEALPLRAPEHVTPMAVARVERWLDEGPHGSAHYSCVDEVYERVVQLAAVPDHPLSADWLHARLRQMPMPERDRVWSIYLHRTWASDEPMGTAVGRLLTWAWPEDAEVRDPTQGYEDEVIELTAKAITWCLTTPNRFIRDRATKALVSLTHRRPHLLIRLLDAFREVDDLYLAERLYAACYGSVLRSQHPAGLSSFAQRVFDLVFATGCPPANVLLRDYARGIVEWAVHHGCRIEGDLGLIRPPYRSAPPPESAPEWDDLRQRHEGREYGGLILSLWPDSGDFARYVLASDSEDRGLQSWTDRPDPFAELHRLDTQRITLPQPLAGRWYAINFPRIRFSISPPVQPPDESDSDDAENNVADEQIEFFDLGGNESGETTEEFLASLTPDEAHLLERHIAADDAWRREFDAARDTRSDLVMAGDFPCRWIFTRVLDVGWTPEQFGSFDTEADAGYGRESRKPERMGKKYQWLAYHELAARVFDHRPMRHDPTHGTAQYAGPWEHHFRQIDPSCLVARPAPDWDGRPCWWAPLHHPLRPTEGATDDEWVRDLTSVPDTSVPLAVRDPADGRVWLSLRTSIAWEQSQADLVRLSRTSRRLLSFTVASVLIRKVDQDHFLERMAGEDWNGMDVRTSEVSEQFLGEFWWAPSYEQIARDASADLSPPIDDGNTAFQCVRNTEIPAATTVMRYLGNSDGFDCSCPEKDTPGGYIPAVWLARRLGLEWAGQQFQFRDSAGRVIAYDPAYSGNGPEGLLFDRDALSEFLRRESLSLVWLIVGEKMVMGADIHDDDRVGRLVFRRLYKLSDDGRPVLTSRRSVLLEQEGETELE